MQCSHLGSRPRLYDLGSIILTTGKLHLPGTSCSLPWMNITRTFMEIAWNYNSYLVTKGNLSELAKCKYYPTKLGRRILLFITEIVSESYSCLFLWLRWPIIFWGGGCCTICQTKILTQQKLLEKNTLQGELWGKIEQVLSTIHILCLTLKKYITSHGPSKNHAQPRDEKNISCPKRLR